MVTILGSGGAIGNELLKELIARNESIRLVSRNPKRVPGVAEAVAADLSDFDDTLKAVSGSRVAFLLAGLKYDVTVWRGPWARLLRKRNENREGAPTQNAFFLQPGNY